MNILHLLSTRCFGGIEVHVADCMELMGQAGHKCHLICKEPPPPELRIYLDSRNISFTTLPLGGILEPASILAIRAFCRRFNIDVIHAHQVNDALRSMIACFPAKASVIFSRHGCYPVKPLSAWLLNACSRCLAISGPVRDILIGAGIRPEKISLLYHGRQAPRPLDHRQACLAVGLDPTRRYVISTGRLSQEKNQLLALEAFGAALLKSPEILENTDLLILGRDYDNPFEPYSLKLSQRAEELGIANRLILPGHVQDVDPWLRASCLGLITSRTEGLSYSMIEYMAASLPVVSTPCEGPSEIIRNGENGYISQADSQDFAQAITQALNPEIRPSLSLKALETWKSLFTPQAMGRALEQIYSQATGLDTDQIRG